MRIVVAIFAFLMAQVSLAQERDDALTTSFLDFGIRCDDPLPEARSSSNSSQLAPRSNPARPLSPANYPPISRQMGEEGTAVVRLLIAESGQVSQAEIAQSTGSPRLDAAALEATRSWHLQPGTLEGKPRCMWGKFAVSFVLTDYSPAQLSQVTVGPKARELAHRFMELQQLKQLMGADSMLTAGERHIMDITTQATTQSKAWLDAEDRIAHILAFEFSETELTEINNFYASPVAAKWMGLNLKMLPTILEEQMIAAQTLQCSMFSINRELRSKKISEVLVNGKLTERYQRALPQFLDATIPVCSCMFRKHSSPPQCGTLPTLRAGER